VARYAPEWTGACSAGAADVSHYAR